MIWAVVLMGFICLVILFFMGRSVHRQREEQIYDEALREAVKKDIKNIASIYPTAFNLYEEPLDRLSWRIVSTVKEKEKG